MLNNLKKKKDEIGYSLNIGCAIYYLSSRQTLTVPKSLFSSDFCKGGFFSENVIHFSDLQVSKKLS